jgi:hypothetical protein
MYSFGGVALAVVLGTACHHKSKEAQAEQTVRQYFAKQYPRCADQLARWKVTIRPNMAMTGWDFMDRHQDPDRFIYEYRGTIRYAGQLCATEWEKDTNTVWYTNCQTSTWSVDGTLRGDMDWAGDVPHVDLLTERAEPPLPIPATPPQFNTFLSQVCEPPVPHKVREHRDGVDADCYADGLICKKARLGDIEALANEVAPIMTSEGWPSGCFELRIIGGDGQERDAVSITVSGKVGLGADRCRESNSATPSRQELSRLASRLKSVVANSKNARNVDLLEVTGGTGLDVQLSLK